MIYTKVVRSVATIKRESNSQLATITTAAEIHEAQAHLLTEANYLTKTLYRKCLKSIQSLAHGNERDESDFVEREQSELDQLDGTNSNSKVTLMAPPVNRHNELSSRANYYKAFTRENFDGHWNLLGRHGFHLGEEGSMRHGLGGVEGSNNGYVGGHHHLGGQIDVQCSGRVSGSVISSDGGGNTVQQKEGEEEEYYMWREEQIEQFTYLITKGEEKRQWILNDYEFNDPCGEEWPEELRTRIKQFEESADAVVKEMYRRRGWIHSSEYERFADEEDSDDEDEDDGY